MASSLSPAQVLPLDVIHSILDWIVLENKSPLHGNSRQVKHLKGLLTVSSAWRHAALEILWRQLNLAIDSAANKVKLRRPGWLKDNSLPLYAANLVKEIHVSFSMSDVINGVAHKLLVDYIGDTMYFYNANKLTVKRVDFGSEHVDSKEIAFSNAHEFAKLLKSMAPAAMTIDVSCGAGRNSQRNTEDSLDRFLNHELVVILSDALYVNAKHAHLNFIDDNMCNLAIVNSIPLLSRLIIYFDSTPDLCASLVHKSASILQYLYIGINDANKLIIDTDGEVVVYPNLQHLHMYRYVRSHSIEMTKVCETVQFPVLRTLILESLYPFHDDVLLRGNNATLEYLDFEIDNATLAMLSQRLVFKDKHKALRHVTIGMLDVNINAIAITKADINKFINNLVSGAKILSVINPSIEIPLILAAQPNQGFQNITVFGTSYNPLSLFDTLSMLKVLPALVDLRSDIIGLGPELEIIPTEDLPDYVTSTYDNVGKSLQIWRFKSPNLHSRFGKADYILLLALVCPRLRQIILKRFTVIDYHTMIADALNSQVYCKYAQQLNRIPDILQD